MKPDKPYRVVSFGEILWDLLPEGKVLGGAPANLAYRLHEQGIPVALVSRLGEDDLGQEATEELDRLGLDQKYIQKDGKLPTGIVEIELDNRGNPDFTIIPDVAYDQIEPTAALQSLFNSVEVVCFGTLVQRSTTARETLYQLLEKSPAKKLVDINLRKKCYSKETVTLSLQAADILKLSNDEVEVLKEMFSFQSNTLDDFCKAVMEEFGLTECLVTRAEDGVFGVSASGEVVDLPGHTVTVADTVGAGDAFTAGFVKGCLAGSSFSDCCQRGNHLGALAATVPGGMTPLNRRSKTILANSP